MRRALPLAAAAFLLGWVALSLTAGGARIAAARLPQRTQRVERPAWPRWAHQPATAKPADPAQQRPVAAMQAPSEGPRAGDAPIAAPSSDTRPAPITRRAALLAAPARRLSGVSVRVTPPPPRAG